MSNKYKQFNIKQHNKNLPLVSVIIPCYNYGHFLEEAIDSVLNQTLTNLEIIVVNDGSTDPNTIEILNSLDKPKTKVIHQKNLKQAKARNNGIKKAKGKYICCLDADDKLEPTYLEECVTKMEIESLDLCGTWLKMFGNEEGIWETEDLDIEIIKERNTIPCASVFTKKIWEKTGGYNSKINGYEDWEFWISIAKAGGKGKIIPKPLFLYRKHGKSEIDRAQKIHNLLVKEIEEKHEEIYNDPKQIKIIKQQQVDYKAKNPFINLKNTGVDTNLLFTNTYLEKEKLLRKNIRIEKNLKDVNKERANMSKDIESLNQEIVDNQKNITNLNQTIDQLNIQNKELLGVIEKIENSYTHRISTFFREKFLDKIIPRKRRKKLLKKDTK